MSVQPSASHRPYGDIEKNKDTVAKPVDGFIQLPVIKLFVSTLTQPVIYSTFSSFLFWCCRDACFFPLKKPNSWHPCRLRAQCIFTLALLPVHVSIPFLLLEDTCIVFEPSHVC